MSRSVWKGPFVDHFLFKKVQKLSLAKQKNIIKIWCRRSVILPLFVGYTFAVHNGKKFVNLRITEDMVGLKFGAFVNTRTYKGHNFNKNEVVKKV